VRAVTDRIDLVWMATSPAAAAAAAATAAGGAGDGAGAAAGGTDYALLRCRAALADGRAAIVLRSVTCDHLPPTAGRRRGELLPSGFLLTRTGPGGPEGPEETAVEYMVQLDRTSADQFDRELAGRSDLLRRSLLRLAAAPSLRAAAAAAAADAESAAAAAGQAGPGDGCVEGGD
jgi:hypothetical protein